MQRRALIIEGDDVTLRGELVTPTQPRALVFLCHGIPASSTQPVDDPGYAGLASTLSDAGYAAAWFDFRGSRSSTGDFSVQGWREDLDSVIDHFWDEPLLDGLSRVVIGSSAGGATAIQAAAERDDLAAVATLAAVASVHDMGLLERPDDLLARMRNSGLIRDPSFPHDLMAWIDGFEQGAALRHIGTIAPKPVLLVHGTGDDVVPYQHAEQLFETASAPKELIRIEGGGHQLRRDPRAVRAVLDWLSRVT